MPRHHFITFLILIASSAALADDKSPATGTWEWGYKTKEGKDAKVSIKLAQDGEKLTGAFVERVGTEVAIEEGKIDGAGNLSFTVTREISGEKRMFKYHGKLEGDTIAGKIDFLKEGKVFPHDWEAKRVKI